MCSPKSLFSLSVEALRPLRHQRGLTLAQAVQHLHTVPACISELERDKRPNADPATTYQNWLTAA